MKIAFTSQGTEWESKMDSRFGRTEFIFVFDEQSKKTSHFDNRAIENEAHGAGPKTSQKLFELEADVLITGNGPGGNAATVLDKAGTKVFIGAGEMSIKEAYDAYKNGALNQI